MPVAVKPCPLLLAALCLLGCGPEARSPSETSDWMLVGLSDRGPESYSALSVAHWDFDEEGNVTVTTFSTNGECGNNARTNHYLWSEAGPRAIEITDLDGGPMNGGGGTSWDRVVFEIGEGCDRTIGQGVDEVHFKNGAETFRATSYVRGKVCLEDLPPCPPEEVECDSCRTVWCEGDPPEPFECDG